MHNRTIFLALLIILGILPDIHCQQYFSQAYTIENGLSTRVVSDVCQDTTGCMWFATYNGISSYDGFQFNNYVPVLGLSQPHYRRVHCDEQGIVWAVPYKLSDSICYFQKDKWRKIAPVARISRNEVNAFDMLYDESGPVLCLGSLEGVEIYQNAQWHHVELTPVASPKHIQYILTNHEKFVVLSPEGIYQLSQDKTGWHGTLILKAPAEGILAIKFERTGMADEKLWVLGRNHLSYLQQGRLVRFAGGFDLPQPELTRKAIMDFDSRGNIFFGNNWAKYYICKTNGTPKPLMVKNGLSSNGATSVFVDREQNVWFTDTRGVDKISNLLLNNYFEINGLLENEVTAILELKDGSMVFGHNNGLTLYRNNTFKRIPFGGRKDNLSRVLDMTQDNHGSTWFAASSHGFGKLKADGTIAWYDIPPGAIATSVHLDSSGTIWFATDRSLSRLENERITAYRPGLKPINALRKIFQTKNNEIMVAGLNGLSLISAHDVVKIPMATGGLNENIFSYYMAPTGEEFVGTLNGLYIIDQGKLKKFTRNGFEINSPVYFIFQDTGQQYWLGSNNGVLKWDGKNSVEIYSPQNGLSGREANRSAGMIDSHGNIWIGTDMGLSCFLPGFSAVKAGIPSVKLLDVEINTGEHYSLSEDCNLTFSDNTLFFHFRGISLVNEALISYRYMLVGFDRNWQLVNQQNLDKVKYTSVDPGTYQLIVQARNDMGPWSNLAKSKFIIISPPFFRAKWFYLLIFVFVFLIIVGGVKIFLQRMYSLKLENEIRERKLSEKRTLETLQALHTSENKFRDLIEFAVDGIVMGSKNGTITAVNSYMQVLTGRSAENLIGINIEELSNHDQLDKVPLRYDLLERGEMVVSLREVRRPDGICIPVEMHTKMMPDGSYQSIYHDITKRLEAEEKLRESRELYKLITDKMTDVVWLMDLNGKSTFVSNSIEQFTGFNVEEYLQQTLDDRFTPASAAEGKSMFFTHVATLTAQPESLQGFSYTKRMEYVCKNGGTRWGELLMTPYFGPNHEWKGIHGVTRDITERKHSEEILKEKADELERFNKVMIGREIRMIELKKEINGLLAASGIQKKYMEHDNV